MLVSAITPAIKYTLQHSAIDFMELAASRVAIGFLFLAGITVWFDLQGLRSLTPREVGKLTLLGLLGVGAYPIAAWGLVYTSVTHFAIIYSLLPTFTTLISMARGKDHASVATVSGLFMSWAGCLLAVLAGPSVLAGVGRRRCPHLAVYPDDVLLPRLEPEHHQASGGVDREYDDVRHGVGGHPVGRGRPRHDTAY